MSSRTRPTVGPSEEEWSHHRELLEKLYIEEGLPLRKVMDCMRDKHGFIAKKNQYEKYLNGKWKLKKKTSSTTWDAIYFHVREFERRGKEAEVWIDGLKRDLSIVRKNAKRNPSRLQPHPVPLPSGISIREAARPKSLTHYILPFQAFGEALQWALPLRLSTPRPLYSSQLNVWQPGPRHIQALETVVPYSLVNWPELFGPFSSTKSEQGLSSPLHRQLLCSISNNFAGLDGVPTQAVMEFLRQETSEGIYQAMQSVSGYYTRQAIILNLFRAAIDNNNAIMVELLLRQSMGIELNSFIFVNSSTVLTPVEKAAILQHTNVVEVLLRYKADVTLSTPGHLGALDRAFDAIREKPRRETIMDPLLYHMLIDAGGKLTLDSLSMFIGYDSLGELALQYIKRNPPEHSEGWTELLYSVFEYQSHETCADIIGWMETQSVTIEWNRCLAKNAVHHSPAPLIDIVAGRGYLNLVTSLIERGANITNNTLRCAISSGNILLVQFILDLKIPVDVMEADGTTFFPSETCLAAAIRTKDRELINLIDQRGSPAAIQHPQSFKSAIAAAVAVNDEQWISRLMELAIETQGNDRSMNLSLALEHVAEMGKEDACLTLLQAGAIVLTSAPLQVALRHHQASLIRALLEADAQPELDHLHQALEWGDHEVIHDLLQAGVNLSHGESLSGLPVAIERKDKVLVKLLLDAGCDVNDSSFDCGTALGAAVGIGSSDMVTYILELGADPHDSEAIYTAAKHQEQHILDILLQAHSYRYPKGRKHWGGDALMLATKNGDFNLFQKLLNAGADPNYAQSYRAKEELVWKTTAQTNLSKEDTNDHWHELSEITAFGYTVLHASKAGLNFANSLLDTHTALCNCYPDTVVVDTTVSYDYGGLKLSYSIHSTAFLVAVQAAYIPMIKLMLRQDGAISNSKARLKVKRTPLQMAAEMGNMEVVQLLLQHGAEVNAPAARTGGGTALQLAAAGGFLVMIRFLREQGADLYAPPSAVDGRMPLEAAAEYGRLDTVAELLLAGAVRQGRDEAQLRRAINFAKYNAHLPVADMLQNYHDKGKVFNLSPVGLEFLNSDLSDAETED